MVRQILIPALHVASFDAGHVTAQPRQLSCTGMLQALSEYDAAVPWSDAASEYDPAVPRSDAAKLPNKTSPMTIAEYDTVRISPPKEMLHRKASTRATPTSENAGRPSFRDVTARDHEGWRVESPGCLYRDQQCWQQGARRGWLTLRAPHIDLGSHTRAALHNVTGGRAVVMWETYPTPQMARGPRTSRAPLAIDSPL